MRVESQGKDRNVQQAVTFASGGEKASRTGRVDGRRLAGRLAGGAVGGLMAWPFASLVGSLTHLHWMGDAGSLAAAISLTAALGAVDRPEAPTAEAPAGAHRAD